MYQLFQVGNGIRTNEEFNHFDRPIQIPAYGRGLRHTIKSHKKKWVEEDMTMEFVNAIENQHNEQEVGHDDTTCMDE